MGKLKDLVKEETSLANRIKYNTRRLRLAGLGLISKVESERSRLYQQLMEAGQGAGDESTLVGVINTLSAGAAKLVREESQRIFEELVVLGERAATPPTVEEVISKAKAAAQVVTDTAKTFHEKASSEKTAAEKPAAKPKTAPVAKTAPATSEKTKAIAADSTGDNLQRAMATLASIDESHAAHAQLKALVLQASEGDVKGRRPAADKASERALFDARKELKGLSEEAALQQFFAQTKKLKKGVPA